MSEQMTLPGMSEYTSLQESRAGSLPCDSQDGKGRCGRGVARANRTRRRGSGKETPTPETYGPISFGSSASAALQSCLASRLARRFGTDGSMEYAETWRLKATPAGRQYWEHTASQRRISDSGCTGWPSPDHHTRGGITKMGPRPSGHKRQTSLQDAAKLTGWPTPNAMEGGATSRSVDRKDELLMGGLVQGLRIERVPVGGTGLGITEPGREATPTTLYPQSLAGWGTPRVTTNNGYPSPQCTGKGSRLEDQVALTGWPTPDAHPDAPNSSTTMENGRIARRLTVQGLGNAAKLTGWNTPRSTDGSKGGPNQAGGALPADAALAGWVTASARDWKDGRASQETMDRNGRPLNEQVVHGLTSPSSTAATARPGASVISQLFSLWLMGYPLSETTPAWNTCSPGWESWALMQRLLSEC